MQACPPKCSLIVAMQYRRRDAFYNRLLFGMLTNGWMQAYSPYTENETNDAILSGWPHFNCSWLVVLASPFPLLLLVAVAPPLSVLIVVVAHALADCFFLLVLFSSVFFLSLYPMYYIYYKYYR